MSSRQPRPKVGIDLAPIGFRKRAPGTAVLVENQARALFALDLEWDWVPIATPKTLREAPSFSELNPIIVPDAPLSYHATWRTGRLWGKAGCALGFSTAFFSSLVGPPVVTNYFDANSFHSVGDAQSRRDRLKKACIQGLWKLSRSRARALFILSEYGRSRMIDADPANASKWIVTPCGVAAMRPVSPTVPVWAESLVDQPFFLYAGAFSENKNQRRLIAAWDEARLRHATFPKLVLIGPASGAYLRNVIEPVRAQTCHPEEIILPGFVTTSELDWAFESATAYIQPSFAEGFGMPVIEAMQRGLPVACSESTSLPEVAGDAAIFFDPAVIPASLKLWRQSPAMRAVRARLRDGRARAGERWFTWEQNAEIVAARIREELGLQAPAKSLE